MEPNTLPVRQNPAINNDTGLVRPVSVLWAHSAVNGLIKFQGCASIDDVTLVRQAIERHLPSLATRVSLASAFPALMEPEESDHPVVSFVLKDECPMPEPAGIADLQRQLNQLLLPLDWRTATAYAILKRHLGDTEVHDGALLIRLRGGHTVPEGVTKESFKRLVGVSDVEIVDSGTGVNVRLNQFVPAVVRRLARIIANRLDVEFIKDPIVSYVTTIRAGDVYAVQQ